MNFQQLLASPRGLSEDPHSSGKLQVCHRARAPAKSLSQLASCSSQPQCPPGGRPLRMGVLGGRSPLQGLL